MNNSAISAACAILLAITIFACVNPSVGQGQTQYLRFHNGTKCSGSSYTIYNTKFNIPAENISSVTINGMWKMAACNNTYCEDDHSSPAVIYYNLCFNIWTWRMDIFNESYSRIDATMFGDANQNATLLYLYPNPNFVGNATIVDTRGVKFNKRMVVRSYYFTGKNEWTLFTGINFNGQRTLLKPSHDHPIIIYRGYGFSSVDNHCFNVGSVRYEEQSSSSSYKMFSSSILFLVVFIKFY